jgi:hypothetical protein
MERGWVMRALKVLGAGALIVGAFLSGQVMAHDTVVMEQVTELSAPGPTPVREVPRDLICGAYTWANEAMDGCEILPEYLALIEAGPVTEYVEVPVIEYVDRPVTQYVEVPVTKEADVQFFEDGSYRINGETGCAPTAICND